MSIPKYDHEPLTAALFPLFLFGVVFVLAMVALLAGPGPRQRSAESYHLLAVRLPPGPGPRFQVPRRLAQPRIDMPSFERDLLALTPTSASAGDGAFGGWGDVRIGPDAADGLARELRLTRWYYSVRVLTACEGAWYCTTNCTTLIHYNQTTTLQHAPDRIPGPPWAAAAAHVPQRWRWR
ncbi:hypothetical protein GGS23DRAFT_615378 [Durotheca rogersii]|uniref:uncharacterized protein n=1 Tax=Durotheca rogersii TaxID=419775 RepID=UPI00221F8152|nr:uncharacterized protein GGS23DRAFT_615378 [Durotheca rogersii]KAI5866798.1 hypothetical protein GGS23DRAFT_615378 [Durotheca rogersii]